jgi:hypothetical protein
MRCYQGTSWNRQLLVSMPVIDLLATVAGQHQMEYSGGTEWHWPLLQLTDEADFGIWQGIVPSGDLPSAS